MGFFGLCAHQDNLTRFALNRASALLPSSYFVGHPEREPPGSRPLPVRVLVGKQKTPLGVFDFVRPPGLEPGTVCLKGNCSTNWAMSALLQLYWYFFGIVNILLLNPSHRLVGLWPKLSYERILIPLSYACQPMAEAHYAVFKFFAKTKTSYKK